MKSFFQIIFGGMLAIVGGIGIFFAGRFVIDKTAPLLANINNSSFMEVIDSDVTDSTSISGLKRTVIYSASEEEALMRMATLSLPIGSIEDISAKAYLVKSLDDGSIVVKKDSDRLFPIASITKLVTAIVAKKLYKDTDKIVITKNIYSTFGNTARFRIGETITVGDILYPLLMVSSNDAAEALAQTYGRKAFLKEMNEFTQSIGAYRTSFSDPSGISPDNRSTAEDLFIILSWIMKNDPKIIEITKQKTKNTRTHSWINSTRFLNWSNYSGGKNGYTEEAKNTGIAIFTMGKIKKPYVVVVLNSKSRDIDIIKLLGKIK